MAEAPGAGAGGLVDELDEPSPSVSAGGAATFSEANVSLCLTEYRGKSAGGRGGGGGPPPRAEGRRTFVLAFSSFLAPSAVVVLDLTRVAELPNERERDLDFPSASNWSASLSDMARTEPCSWVT